MQKSDNTNHRSKIPQNGKSMLPFETITNHILCLCLVQTSMQVKDFINGINSPSIFHFYFPHHCLSKPFHIKDLVDPWKSGNKETNHCRQQTSKVLEGIPRSLKLSTRWLQPSGFFPPNADYHAVTVMVLNWSAGNICYWYWWFY